MKIAAGHESKHKAAMSKAGDVLVVIPISTVPRMVYSLDLLHTHARTHHIFKLVPFKLKM